MLPVVRGDGKLRGGTGSFLQKRARRILPPYYFTIAFSILLDYVLIGHKTGNLWDDTLPLTWHSVVTHFLLLQDFSGMELHKINYVLWSISLEWWIYFLFPSLVWAWKQFGVGKTILLAVTATFLLCQACGHFFHDNFTLYYIDLFVFGMLGAEIAYTSQTAIRALRDRLRWDALTIAVLLLTALAMTGRVPHFSSTNVVDSLVGLSTVCLLVTISLRPASLVRRGLSYKPMMFVGSFAYSIYLVHAPLLQILWHYIISPLHLTPIHAFFVLELVGVPIIVSIAYLFHLAFERPFMTKPGVKIKTEVQAEAAAIVNPAP